ncbi:MAG TPA: TolC family protein [Polyangiaceae bacterium]|jgi:cobalt-zinc-cadmium efflux system outer membrane protein|nr:TolC family protein [Polyangiaceae bacterium]
MKLLRQLSLVAFAGSLVLAPALARAQVAASSTAQRELASEDALVQFALAHNPDLRAAHWDQNVAAASLTSASALNNPVARGEWLHVQSPSDFGWGVGLEWAPPQPGVYGSVKDAARAQVRAVTADFSERRAELEAAVRLRYAQIGALTEEISLAEKSVETRRAVHQTAKERVSHGASSRIDLSLVAVSLARGEQERDLLLLARETEITQLEAQVGLPPGQSLALTPRLTTDDTARDARAPAQRPQLQADAARADAADSTLAAERAKRWPWLAVQARYRKHDQSNHPDDVTLGLEVTLPIFNQNPGPIAAAEASRHALRDVATAHRLAIERDVRVLKAESARRREIAEHYAQSIAPVLNEHAALVKQALSGMELDLTALLTAEDMVTRSGIEYMEARLAQRKAEIALARALGEYGRATGGK